MEIPNIQCGIALGVCLVSLIDTLEDEGFRPKRVSASEVSFTRNKKTYLASCPEGEGTLLTLCSPPLYKISGHDDRGSILEAINRINGNCTLGKIVIKNNSVRAFVEARYQRMGAAAALLSSYIDDIDALVEAFRLRARIEGRPEMPI